MLRASLLTTPEWRSDPKPHKCFDSNCAHHISGFSSRQACQDHVDTCHRDALAGYRCLFEGCNLFIPGRPQMDAHMREEHGWIHSTCADIHGGCLVGDPMSCLRLTQTWKMPSITGRPSPSARQTPASNAWLSEHHPSPAVHSIQTAQGSDMQMSTGSGASRRHSRSSELSTRWTPRDQSIGLPVPLDTPSRQPWSPAIQTDGHESGVIYHGIESDAGSYMSEHQQGQDWTAWMPEDLLPPIVQSAQPCSPTSQYDGRSATEPIWDPEAVHVTSSQIRPRYTFQLSVSEPIEALSNSPLRVHSQRTIDIPGQRAGYSAAQVPLRWFNDLDTQYNHYTGTLYPQVQAQARSADQYPSHPCFAEAELPHLHTRCCDLPHHALHPHYNYDDWRMYDDWGAQLSPTWMLF